MAGNENDYKWDTTAAIKLAAPEVTMYTCSICYCDCLKCAHFDSKEQNIR